MHKIWLIISREYLVRVRKKSFIIMTILGPILMAALMIVPIYLANESKQERFIAINEQSEYILEDTDLLHFTQIPNIEAINLNNLRKINNYVKNFKIFISFYINKVRLIDNI